MLGFVIDVLFVASNFEFTAKIMHNRSSVLRIGILITGLFVVGLCSGAEAYASNTQVRTVLKTSVDVAGQAIRYPTNGIPEISGVLVEIPVGAQTGWHLHPSPCVAYVLQGEITVEVETGAKNSFKAGDSFAEVRNLKHCGYNTGTVPVKIILFAIGTQGAPISTLVRQ